MEKTKNKNTGLFINWMDFVVMCPKINKKYFSYAWALLEIKTAYSNMEILNTYAKIEHCGYMFCIINFYIKS
jgi:hypothetical protein